MDTTGFFEPDFDAGPLIPLFMQAQGMILATLARKAAPFPAEPLYRFTLLAVYAARLTQPFGDVDGAHLLSIVTIAAARREVALAAEWETLRFEMLNYLLATGIEAILEDFHAVYGRFCADGWIVDHDTRGPVEPPPHPSAAGKTRVGSEAWH